MASRKDQLHSYQFMMQRVISSVVLRETDPEQAPLRRGVGSIFGSVMLAAVLAAGFGVYTVITGVESGRWQNPGTIIIERETGAHYVYREDGTLQPVLNYASARLLSSGTGNPQRVAGRNLAGIRRTVMVGIPGAPNSLPPPDRTAGAPWTLCSILEPDAAGSPVTATALLLGERVPGGDPFGERGMLVRDAEEGTSYLLWHSQRYRITGDDPGRVVQSLYGSQAATVDVGSAWLNGLPSGQDIGPIAVEGLGEESPAVSDFQIGDVVFHPVADGEQNYLVLAEGLAPLTELQVAVLRGQFEVEPQEISASAAAGAPTSDALVPAEGEAAPPPAPPELLPAPVTGEATLCAETADVRSPSLLSLGGDLSAVADGAIPTSGESDEGVELADWVAVPPGEIAVVRAMASANAPTGALQLVTDAGIRFPVPTVEALASLGYDAAGAVAMPAALVQRIPDGPTLDPAAAAQPAPVGPAP
jgi:type VII secretion protein EccB